MSSFVLVALILCHPSKLPQLGRAVGTTLSDFAGEAGAGGGNRVECHHWGRIRTNVDKNLSGPN
ncbi:twin-arginine translocase TatA/TatE family subunit [Paenibacillus elgii]|uniref:twin-arginine translocase TatA/TatE family subunit n=1 Tax=Paenibacillus elgii TaxID=189691 RepID=UPI002F907A56